MKILEQSWSFENTPRGQEIITLLERAGRTCYKSESRITPESAADFIKSIIKNGHHSVLEHANITVRIITNRGVTHELVRHRLAAYSQESTRYCNYSGEMEFILPVWLVGDEANLLEYFVWSETMRFCEARYNQFLSIGWKPEQARGVLPNDLKTEIVMTANIREWRHVFALRCSKRAHPQMRALMRDMLKDFQKFVPTIFDDITYEE